MRTRGEESGSPDAIPVLASDLITSQASWCGWEEEVEPFAARSATIMKPELAVVSDCSIDRTTTDSPNRLDRPLRKPRRSPRPGFPFRWTGFLPQRARSKTPFGNPTRWSPALVGLRSPAHAAITRYSCLLGGCPPLPYGKWGFSMGEEAFSLG